MLINDLSNIKKNDRFYIVNDNSIKIKNKSEIRLIDRLQGKTRLTCCLKIINEYLSKIDAKSLNERELNDFKGKISSLIEEYNKKHSKIYRLLFARGLNGLGQKIDQVINQILKINTENKSEQEDKNELSESNGSATEEIPEKKPLLTKAHAESLFTIKKKIAKTTVYEKRKLIPIEPVFVNNSSLQNNDSTDSFVDMKEIPPESMLDSFISLPDNRSLPNDQGLLLLDGVKDGVKLNELLTEQFWQAILLINDLSYQEAKRHTINIDEKKELNETRFQANIKSLENLGWKGGMKTLVGATGVGNVDQDMACIITVNKEQKLVLVAFHGSRSGSKNPLSGNKHGDWAANFDYEMISAKECGISLDSVPEGVFLHRGFGLNFAAVQKPLLETLQQYVNYLGNETTIIVTGHSKGAAEATIAAPVIKSFFNNNIGDAKVDVKAITLSSPMVFNQQGQQWVHNVIGKRNFLYIGVKGDPILSAPPFLKDFRRVGVLILDDIAKVRQRVESTLNYQGPFSNYVAQYHYGAFRDNSHCFVPETVIPRNEIIDGFNRGLQELYSAGNPFLTDSFFGSDYRNDRD